MNYIREVNAFYDWLETNSISASSIALWHALMAINNKAGWIREFGVATSVLQAKTGLKKDAIVRARNALHQSGRLKWRSRNGNQSAIYELISFEVNCVGLNDANHTTHHNAIHNTNSAHTATQTATINKLNKTKLNKTKKEKNVDDSEMESQAAETITDDPEIETTKPSLIYTESSEFYQGALYLRGKILEFNPKCKCPEIKSSGFQKWANVIRLLFEQDRRTSEEFSSIIEYVFSVDDFWAAQIQSPNGLRKHWDKIWAKKIRGSTKNVVNGGFQAQIDKMRDW